MVEITYKRKIQLTVFVKNIPGQFAEVCDVLYSRGVDIQAMCAFTQSDFGVLRIVPDDVPAAMVALEESDIKFLQSEVLVAETSHKTGMAAGLGHRLAQSNINIEYVYFSGGEEGTRGLIVFKISKLDMERAIKQLNHPQTGYN